MRVSFGLPNGPPAGFPAGFPAGLPTLEPDGAAHLVPHGPKCTAGCERSGLAGPCGDILRKMRFAAICTLIATLILLGAPAHPAAAADPVLTAELVDFRPWLGPTNHPTATLHLPHHRSDPLPLSGGANHRGG